MARDGDVSLTYGSDTARLVQLLLLQQSVIEELAACTCQPGVSLRELTRRHVAMTLAYTGGHKVTAARLLGINLKTLYSMLSRERAREPARGG